MTEGYARIAVGAAWHFWMPWDGNRFYLIPRCKRTLMLPAAGAKLKDRERLTPAEVKRICRDCGERTEATK